MQTPEIRKALRPLLDGAHPESAVGKSCLNRVRAADPDVVAELLEPLGAQLTQKALVTAGHSSADASEVVKARIARIRDGRDSYDPFLGAAPSGHDRDGPEASHPDAADIHVGPRPSWA